MSLVAAEVEELLRDLESASGIDYRLLRGPVLDGRVAAHLREESIGDVAELRRRIGGDGRALDRLLVALSRREGTLFEDPALWLALRRKVAPLLHTYPSTKVWVPGCSTGEVAYSVAILLREEGLLERATIYATELHEAVLARARLGLLKTEATARATRDYRDAGGRATFAEYYTMRGGAPATRDRRDETTELRPLLREKIAFAQHNLATDASFNEFHLIVAPRVGSELIPEVERRAHRIFGESLCRFGVLVTGADADLGDGERARYETFTDLGTGAPVVLRKERP